MHGRLELLKKKEWFHPWPKAVSCEASPLDRPKRYVVKAHQSAIKIKKS
jgi:hypothetical protein